MTSSANSKRSPSPYQKAFTPIAEYGICAALKLENGELKYSLENQKTRKKRGGGEYVPLPGYPLTDVNKKEEIEEYLGSEFANKKTDKLDALSKYFFFVATPKSSHISSACQQIVRGREIVITEDAGLHLLWYYSKVFVKPIPEYLLSTVFWEKYLSEPNSPKVQKAILGFMRSYAYLVKSRLDFKNAIQRGLIPILNDTDADYEKFLFFIDPFRTDVLDDEVSPRYRYGDLRLSRINLIHLLIPKNLFTLDFFYHKVHGQHGQLINEFLAPFIFIFATVSVALTAMQLAVAVRQQRLEYTPGVPGEEPSSWDVLPLSAQNEEKRWYPFYDVSIWFSVACVLIVAFCIAAVPIIESMMLLRELIFALRKTFFARRDRKKADSDKDA